MYYGESPFLVENYMVENGEDNGMGICLQIPSRVSAFYSGKLPKVAFR